MSSFGYEIDFLPVGDGEKSGDAIALRYGQPGAYTIHVVDGGTLDSGDALVEHINKYYDAPTFVDHVVCTHPDADHASGLRKVLDGFQVGRLWMNRPWLYVNELLPRFSDTRITADSLERRLKEAYPYIDVLEKLAKVHGVDVLEAFEGQQVGAFTVLSPSRAFYLDLLVESLKTPDAKDVAPAQSIRTQFLGLAAPDIELVQEEWGKESLKEGGVTRPDNETSIVQFANFEGRHINLNGDAGIRALISSADYLERMLERIPRPQFMQIPHHGSRRNVAPSVLNRWLGLPILEGEPFRTTAFVSAGKGSSKHPRKAVVNAFMRRGAKVCKTSGKTIRHYHNMPERSGWCPTTPEPFSSEVEAYTVDPQRKPSLATYLSSSSRA